MKRQRAEDEIQSENNAINNSENEYNDEDDDQQAQGSGHRSKYSQSEGTRKVEVDSANGALTASSKLKNLYKSAQVLDVNQALKQNQDQEQLKQSLAQMKPILKKVPGLKLYGESTMLLLRYDYQPINLELISLQIVLSKIL